MTWQRLIRWMRRYGLVAAGILAVAIVFVWPDRVLGSADAPGCNDVKVENTVVDIFNRHPDYIGRSTKIMTGLAEAREVEFRRHPEVNATANTRWCQAKGRFSGGETEVVYYDLFATRTLGVVSAYGVRPCFGRFDPRHKDCSFAQPPQR